MLHYDATVRLPSFVVNDGNGREDGRSVVARTQGTERVRDGGIVLVGQQQQNFTLRIDRQKLRSVRVEQKQKQHFIAHSTFDPIYNNVMSVRGGREGGRQVEWAAG